MHMVQIILNIKLLDLIFYVIKKIFVLCNDRIQSILGGSSTRSLLRQAFLPFEVHVCSIYLSKVKRCVLF